MTHSQADAGELRKIPAVHELLNAVLLSSWAVDYGATNVAVAVREELDELRSRLIEKGGAVPLLDNLVQSVHARLKTSDSYSLRRVINATGIIVHTNLGRAPLPQAALEHMADVAGYSNLEFDLEQGIRGSREKHLEGFLSRLLSCEASLVVNNNASALMLMLNTFAEDKEVIVSRGELVEIGGSFRLPEIMKKSQATLHEVGTTNKTRLLDYRNAINARTGLILVVHPSNYQIIGFTEKPDPKEVIELGREFAVPVMEDHGSGILQDLSAYGIPGEPSAMQRIAMGFDAVGFSGDKILGGPQAGIVCGRKDSVERMRKNPLFRALRVDKLVYAALEATLRLYIQDRTQEIPVVRMLSLTEKEMEQSAQKWSIDLEKNIGDIAFEVVQTVCYVGGGVAPMKGLDSCAVAIRHSKISAKSIAMALRKHDPPIVARIEDDRVLFELRTLTEDELAIITTALATL